ncbi:MAG: SDR family oxidoreductase [Steroidobacteraceae bacterium]
MAGIAVVTGGAGGIGAATCRALARTGRAVVCADIATEAGARFASDCQSENLAVSFQPLDVSDEQSWHRLRDVLAAMGQQPAILVNNAGIDVVKDIFATTGEDWDRLFRVNMKGMFLGAKVLARDMHAWALANDQHASIINMSSICGLIGVPFQTAYCATKGAVRMFSKALALELAALKLRIRVNSIHPGSVDTAFAAQCLKELGEVGFAPSPEEARAAIDRAHPIGQMAKPEEIADAIVFLASEQSRFMTGSELVVDGGYTSQ